MDLPLRAVRLDIEHAVRRAAHIATHTTTICQIPAGEKMCTTPSKSAYLFMVLSGGIIDTYPGGKIMHRYTASLLLVLFLALPCSAKGSDDKETPPQGSPSQTFRLGALKGPTGIGMIHLFEATTPLPHGVKLMVEAIGSSDTMVARDRKSVV